MNKPSVNNCWIALILIFSSCNISRQAKLNRVWPIHYRFLSSSAKDIAAVQKGYVKMQISYNDGETIGEVPVLPFDKKREMDILHIALDDIDLVRIYSPRGTTFGDYMPVGSAMWSLLGRKGQVSVCYQVWGKPYWDDPNNYYDEAALVSGQRVTQIGMGGGAYDRRIFVKFINKRYGKHFTTKDFRRKKSAIIQYILDQENLKAPGRSSS